MKKLMITMIAGAIALGANVATAEMETSKPHSAVVINYDENLEAQLLERADFHTPYGKAMQDRWLFTPIRHNTDLNLGELPAKQMKQSHVKEFNEMIALSLEINAFFEKNEDYNGRLRMKEGLLNQRIVWLATHIMNFYDLHSRHADTAEKREYFGQVKAEVYVAMVQFRRITGTRIDELTNRLIINEEIASGNKGVHLHSMATTNSSSDEQDLKVWNIMRDYFKEEFRLISKDNADKLING
ncbi:hypothetical protein ACMXYX_17665 (plasmid) [Neptuniibacter sp. QD72_48]|uniref:hypothetical protein n=1 Tax=Neptuniibacter sp. QD72_48 TaxID=3398214 RepID=UPI0039F59069